MKNVSVAKHILQSSETSSAIKQPKPFLVLRLCLQLFCSCVNRACAGQSTLSYPLKVEPIFTPIFVNFWWRCPELNRSPFSFEKSILNYIPIYVGRVFHRPTNHSETEIGTGPEIGVIITSIEILNKAYCTVQIVSKGIHATHF